MSPAVPTLSPPGSHDRSDGALEPYLRALRLHWKLVLLVTLVTLGASAAWLAARTPAYESSAQILIAPLPSDDSTFEGVDALRSDASDSTRTVQTAASLIDSPEAANQTARALGDGYTRDSVQAAVQVETRGETNILAVTATADSPQKAARLANGFARASLDARAARVRSQVTRKLQTLRGIQSGGNVTGQAGADLAQTIERLQSVSDSGDPAFSLTQRAFPPAGSTQTSSRVVIFLALVAGFTLGSGAALLIEITNRRVRDEDELRAIYPLPVLAHVPIVSGRQRKALRNPLSAPPAVQEAFRTLQVQLDRQGMMPRVLMFTSASSGDAKSTSAANLAVAMVAAGHRVILIDFDLRKPDVGNLVGVKPTRPLVSLLSPETTLEEMLVDAPRIPSLRVLAADNDRDVMLLEPLSRRLPSLFAEARELADYILVDTPPLGEVSDALRLVDIVDDVVITARPGHSNRANVELLRDLLSRAGKAPTGMVVIGDAPGSVSSYYAHGAANRAQRARSTTAKS